MAERPDIADKVRFWEEQDRINKELIPRVLKIHELLSEHVARHQDASTQIAASEARLAQRIHKARLQATAIAGLSLAVALVAIVLSVVL
jgi:hypothetical protein